MSEQHELPAGFLAAGMNAGIKNSKRDLGVIVCDVDATFAACTTRNLSRAHCVDRTERLLAAGGTIRAVVACSGNANALTGPKGAADDDGMAATIAAHLGIEASAVATAATGVIGARLPLQKIEAASQSLLSGLSTDPVPFAESVLTTDRVTKIASREIFIAGKRIRILGIAKGAGMIAPSMATMLCFVTTDAAIGRESLQSALSEVVEDSFNQITVDEDMSTNDMVMVMASGVADGEPVDATDDGKQAFKSALGEVLEDLAKAIASDGEGATRLLTVKVAGAASKEDARTLSRAVASSSLVKSAIFGADPYAWGRMISAMGARASQTGARFDVATLQVRLQGVSVFEAGSPVELPDHSHGLKHRMTEPEVLVEADLGAGAEAATAWGCDLTYDYVKINADYASVTTTAADGSVSVNERLGEFGPTIKKKLLIEALRYIEQFHGLRAVIKLGGAAMIEPKLEEQFAQDVLLLESVGLRPIVVHGGGPEISRTLDRLGHRTEFVDGLRVTDEASMGVVEMVLSGKVNQRLVAALNRAGTQGVGLSGKDGGLLRARKLESHKDLGQVGEVVSVETSLINMLLEDGRVPVVSPVGLGEDGLAYNINADVVAAELSAALGASKLIFLSDVPGFLEDDQVVSEMDADALKARIDRGEVTGGMLPKLQAALRALRAGVISVHLVDGRVPHNLIAELFTDRGVGTLIHKS